jgi:hypothetical protein
MTKYSVGQGVERIKDILLSMNHLVEMTDMKNVPKPMRDSDDYNNYHIFYDIVKYQIILLNKVNPTIHIALNYPQGWIKLENEKVVQFLNVMAKESKSYEDTPEEKNMKAFR